MTDGPSALTAALASRFARMARANVVREYPNKLDHVLSGAADVRGPRALHPIFYGSFDWHSCVHGYWLLARILRRFPELLEARAIAAVIDAHFTVANVAAECAYLAKPSSRTFERPYGLAWLLMLAAELACYETQQGQRWSEILAPLATACAARLRDYFAAAGYPVRAGMHTNSAFALALSFEYAEACRDGAMAAIVRAKSQAWFGQDRDYPAWEPDGEDFLSPALIEALLMSRVLAPRDFMPWLEGFLPRLAKREPAALFRAAVVADRTDPRFVHLDGVNLSRAWCWKVVGARFAGDDPRRAIAQQAAHAHLDASLPHIGDDYAGSHWLASFALLAIDA